MKKKKKKMRLETKVELCFCNRIHETPRNEVNNILLTLEFCA